MAGFGSRMHSSVKSLKAGEIWEDMTGCTREKSPHELYRHKQDLFGNFWQLSSVTGSRTEKHLCPAKRSVVMLLKLSPNKRVSLCNFYFIAQSNGYGVSKEVRAYHRCSGRGDTDIYQIEQSTINSISCNTS